mgnify:CR=1 FL=1
MFSIKNNISWSRTDIRASQGSDVGKAGLQLGNGFGAGGESAADFNHWEECMRIVLVTLFSIFASSVAVAECPAPLATSDLGPLAEEDQQLLDQLDEIENEPDAKAQAEAEAAIPIEAFGGQGVCSDGISVSGSSGNCVAPYEHDGN